MQGLTADTLILTRDGYLPITECDGKEIFSPFFFSKDAIYGQDTYNTVKVYSLGLQDVYKVNYYISYNIHNPPLNTTFLKCTKDTEIRRNLFHWDKIHATHNISGAQYGNYLLNYPIHKAKCSHKLNNSFGTNCNTSEHYAFGEIENIQKLDKEMVYVLNVPFFIANGLNISNENYNNTIEKIQQNNAAKIIQRACHNWLWKPICNDNTYGINLRLGLAENEKFNNSK